MARVIKLPPKSLPQQSPTTCKALGLFITPISHAFTCGFCNCSAMQTDKLAYDPDKLAYDLDKSAFDPGKLAYDPDKLAHDPDRKQQAGRQVGRR